jgi:flagellar biosynthesis/type III secretory pathway protein FliH
MNNKPVAWMDYLEHSDVYDLNVSGRGVPLYTHPVKDLDEQFKKGFKAGKEEGWKAHKFHYPVKELTDAITLLEKYADKLEDERPNKGLSDVVLECVEILRKAQEK